MYTEIALGIALVISCMLNIAYRRLVRRLLVKDKLSEILLSTKEEVIELQRENMGKQRILIDNMDSYIKKLEDQNNFTKINPN